MNRIVALKYGHNGNDVFAVSCDRLVNYAVRCNTEIKVVELEGSPSYSKAMLLKMKLMRESLGEATRILYVDGDVMIRNDAPNLFEIVKPCDFAGVDELALCTSGDEIKTRQDHMASVSLAEYGTEMQCYRYFNMGVVVASDASLFVDRKTEEDHPWCEQTVVNTRLANRNVICLPPCFNEFYYWGIKPRFFERSSYMIHFAGAPSHKTRLNDMKHLDRIWRNSGL